jgi:cardiolipin synthase
MSWLVLLNVLEWFIRIAMVLVILQRRLPPPTSLAWLSIVFFQPELGILTYWLVGENRLAQKRVEQHRQMLAAMRSGAGSDGSPASTAAPSTENSRPIPVSRQAERLTGLPIIGGNDVRLIDDTDEMIRQLIDDIDAARRHVHLLYYIYVPDETGRRVADALLRAAKRGVTCRLLADAVGSRRLFNRKGLSHRLNAAGVRTVAALPAAPLRRRLARVDLRNHRKLAVIDGAVAYSGSQNIVNADYGHRRAGSWIDMTGRFTGPVVAQLQSVFLEDWAFETDEELRGEDVFPAPTATGTMPAQAVPTGPSQVSVALPRIILAALNAAQERIIITSPYLVPDQSTMLALTMAADRGAQVDLVIPFLSDHPVVSAAGRAYFDQLLDSGVNIYMHSPGMLHAKTMTVDDSVALLGSSNLDIRSFYLNFELNVLMYGPQITDLMRQAQVKYIHEARPIRPHLWRQRPKVHRLAESAAMLLSPLL